MFASSGISARASLGSSAGFTLPYFELVERGCVLAPSGTTTPTLLLLAEQLGSTAAMLKIVARIAVRLIITLNPFRAIRNTSNQDTTEKWRTENDLAQFPERRCLQSAQHAHEKSTQMIRTSNSMTTIPNTNTANATASYSSQIGMIAPHRPLPTDLQNGLLRLPNRYRRIAFQLIPLRR